MTAITDEWVEPRGPAAELLDRQIETLKARLEQLTGVERDLRAQKALLRTVLDESPDLIALKDHNGNFLLTNQPVASFYGTTPDAMVGKHDGDFSATPEQAAFSRANVLAIMARGTTEVVLEESTDVRTGETRYFRSIKKPFVAEDGLARVLVIAHDITDIRRAQQKVQESESRLSYVLNVIGEGVWDWNIATGRMQHNPRWYELTGYAPADLGATIADFEHCLFPEDRATVRAAIDRCIQGAGPYCSEHRIRRKDGQVIWALDRGDVVERDAAGRALRMVGSFSDVTERKLAEAETQRLAFFDPLTGLPNRRLMLDRLQRAIGASARTAQHGALLFMDLDDFKDLNDARGHAAGDTLLRQVAQRLTGGLRKVDTAARMGGDEFVAILENLGPSALQAASNAEAIAQNVMQRVGEPYEIAGSRCHSTASIGIALFGQTDDTADELLKRADFAMYQAKDAGRNTLRFYDPAMQQAMLMRASLEAGLRRAIDQGELCIYLQPVVDTAMRMVGTEALVRWRHPQRGIVGPAEFIGLAEQGGMILALGRQVLEAACNQLVSWSRHPSTARLTMSVNVSARQFHAADFVTQVVEIIDRTGADAKLLKLELTESVLLSDVEAVVVKMSDLKARGVCFSIDDFGTGYSSLSYLKRLPIEELKIDRSFVNDVLTDANDASIVHTILALAQRFSLRVVAEGVETEGQRDFLLENGCQLFQGYLFGRPVPVSELALPSD